MLSQAVEGWDFAVPSAYLIAGVALLLAAVLPHLLAPRYMSPAMVFVGGGLVAALIPGTPDWHPQDDLAAVEHATELCVLISLMGVGLALDRPLGLRSWASAWLLIGVAMPLIIAATALGAGLLLGVGAATALLLGGVLAPTDPVLASDVRVGEPTDDPASEDDLRFALTAEAGLNDALAFPFVQAGLLLLVAAAGQTWVPGWVGWDLVGRVLIGVAAGLAVGTAFGYMAFRAPVGAMRVAETSEAVVALAAVFLAYGAAELLGGYGFLSVFVAALALRASERGHTFHVVLHSFIQQVERILTLGRLVLFGYAIGSGLLAPLTLFGALFGLTAVLAIRPLLAWISLSGMDLAAADRRSIAFFGMKGIGSFYYLAFALGQAPLGDARFLWSVVGFTVLLSVVIHGVTATPVIRRIDRRLGRRTPDPS